MDRFIGKRLDGRYEIREILGVGGMAVVYKAYDNVEDRIVAIKILKEEFATNEEFLRRFRNESKAISLLSHPNIVKIYDVSFGDIIQYIVMEYIEGITLKEHIEREGCLSWKDAVYYTIQILRGLQHAHDRGIVHRDVKPQNIILLPDGTIKVTDFGIARFARSEQKTITDKAIGSVHYISPEQARGEATDEKADIYSVGVILYEMLTGKLPFEAESAVSVAIMQLQREPKLPTEINGSIPLGVEQITMRAMQKSTVNRYKSSSEMLCDLEKFKKDPAMTFDFTYFVDDSPTKFLDIDATNDEDDLAEEKEKGSIIPILAGVAATFFVAVVAVFLIFFLPKFTGSTGSEIKCPSFVGQSYDALSKDESIKEQFEISFKWYPNSDYPYGVVFEQSQPANKNVKKGASIELSVSMGIETKTVPDVRGYSESNAKRTLELQGFKVKIEPKADDEIETGLAVNTYPASGSSVVDGYEITLYISSGAPTVYVPLPNVVNLSETDAKDILAKAGLTSKTEIVNNINGQNVPKGVVSAQEPAYSQGKEVGKGTEVILKVSSGKFASDVKVNIPEGATSAALFVNGALEKENRSINSGETTCTFSDVANENRTVDAVVKIKTADITEYTDYMEITVDLTTGNVTENKVIPFGEE